jgi:signal transduction histidine kinase
VGVVLVAGWGIRVISSSEKQREANHLLQQRNRDLDAFAGRVAHDLKNALATLPLSASMIRRGRADPALLAIADRVERSSRRANATINALRALSQVVPGAHVEETGRLRPAITSAREELAQQAAALDVSLEVEEVPDVYVRCDVDLLHIVFANVLGNAIKFLTGRAERRVCISTHLLGSSCCVQVEDTGPGVPAWALDKIFEPFFRMPGLQVPGEGLGLATVQRIVAARGGSITVESELGRGTRFNVCLPLTPSPEPEPGPSHGESAQGVL